MTTNPSQPDGIEEDSHDLPDPQKAAQRVNTFLSAYGDGLIIAEWLPEYLPPGGQPPLYARDLQALTNLALTPTAETTITPDFTHFKQETQKAINLSEYSPPATD